MVGPGEKIVAIRMAGSCAGWIDVGFVLGWQEGGEWYYQHLVLGARGKRQMRRLLPAAGRLYRRVKRIEGVRPGLRFKECAM